MSWNWDCDRNTQSNLTTDFQNSANFASNNGINSESANKGRSRSPVRKIMRNRASESSGVVITDIKVNNLRQHNSGGSRISRFHSATSSSKDYGPNSSYIQSQDDEDYWMNRNKRSNKDVVATDVYGEKYASILQHDPEQEDNSQTSNEDDESIQEYQNMLMKIQSFSGQVTQDKDFACEQLFKDYCDALELHSEVNFKFKTKNRKRLNAFSIEVFNGSFYWQEIEGQYLTDSEEARQRAFVTACTVLIEKFGWAIRAKIDHKTKSLPPPSAELALQNTAAKIENPQCNQNSWEQATKNYWTTWASHFGTSIPHPQPYYPPPLPPDPPPPNQPYISVQAPSPLQPQLPSGSPQHLNPALYISQALPVTPYSNLQPPLPLEPYPYNDLQPTLPFSVNSQPLLPFGQLIEKPLQPPPSTQALTQTQPSLSLQPFMQTPVQPPLPPEPFVQKPLKPPLPPEPFVQKRLNPPLPPQPFLQSPLQPPLPPEPFIQKTVKPPLPPQPFVQIPLQPPLPSEPLLPTFQHHLRPPKSPQPQLTHPQPNESDQTSQLLIQQPSQNPSPLPCKLSQPLASSLLPSRPSYKNSTRSQPLLSHKPIVIRFNQPDATSLSQEIKRLQPQQPSSSKKIKITKSPLSFPEEIKHAQLPSIPQQTKCLEPELSVSSESPFLKSPARSVTVQHRSKPPASISENLPVSSVLYSEELLCKQTKLTPTSPGRSVTVQHRSKQPASISENLPVSSLLDSEELLCRPTKLTPTSPGRSVTVQHLSKPPASINENLPVSSLLYSEELLCRQTKLIPTSIGRSVTVRHRSKPPASISENLPVSSLLDSEELLSRQTKLTPTSPGHGVTVQHRSKPPASISENLPVSSLLDSEELLCRQTKLTPTTTKSMSSFSLPPPEVRLYHPVSNSPSNQFLLNEPLQPPEEFCDNSTICPPEQSFGIANETFILPPPKPFLNNIDLPNISAPPQISPFAPALSVDTALGVQKPGLAPIQKTVCVAQINATENASCANSELEKPEPGRKRPRNLISLVSSAPRIKWLKKCEDATPNIISSETSGKSQTNTQEQIQSTSASSFLPDKDEIPSPSKTKLVSISASQNLEAEVPIVSYTIDKTKEEEKEEETQKTVNSFTNIAGIGETQKIETQSKKAFPLENDHSPKHEEINVEIEISNNEVTTTTPQILLDPEVPMSTNSVTDSSLISSDGNLNLKEAEIDSCNIPNRSGLKLDNISSASKIPNPVKDKETIVSDCPVSSTISTQHSKMDEVYSSLILNQESKKQIECNNVEKSNDSKPVQVSPKGISRGVEDKGISGCRKLPFGYATPADLEFLRSLKSNTIAEPESCSVKHLDILFSGDSPASKKQPLQNELRGKKKKRKKKKIVPKLNTKTLIHRPVSSTVPPKPVALAALPKPLPLAVQPKPLSLAVQPKPLPLAVQPNPLPLAVQPNPLPLAVQPKPLPLAVQPNPLPLAVQPKPLPLAVQPKPLSLAVQPKPVALEAVSQPVALEAVPQPVALEAEPQPVALAVLAKPVSLAVLPKPTNDAIAEDKNENVNEVDVQNRNKIHEEQSMNKDTDNKPNRFTMASTRADCSYMDFSLDKHPPSFQQRFQRGSWNHHGGTKTQYPDQFFDPHRSFGQHHGQPPAFTPNEDLGFDRDPDFDRDPEFAAGPSINPMPDHPILSNDLRTNGSKWAHPFHKQKHSHHPHQGFSRNHGNLNRHQHLDPDCGQRSWETGDEGAYNDCDQGSWETGDEGTYNDCGQGSWKTGDEGTYNDFVAPTWTPQFNRFYPNDEETPTSFPKDFSHRGRGRRFTSHRARRFF